MKIAITGGTGFIGSAIVRRMAAHGYQFRCLVRPESNLARLPGDVETVQGDVRDADSLRRLLEGCQAVYHLAAATSAGASRDQALREAINVGGTRNLIEACRAVGVQRVIVMSSQSVKRERQAAYGRTKKQADEMLLASGLDVTILRPTIVYGPGAKGIFAQMVKLIEALPIVPIIGSGRYQTQPTYIEDVAQAAEAALKSPASIGQTYDLGGADRIEFREFIRRIAEARNLKKRLVNVPIWMVMLGARLLGLVMKRPPITVDNVLGVIQETQIDLEPARHDLAYNPVGLEAGLRETFLTRPAFVVKRGARMRVAVIGMGKMGILHANLINVLPNAEVAAMMDLKSGAGSYARGLGLSAPFYQSLDELLAGQDDLDATIICVPPAHTLSAVEACARRGLHMLVEKPLADSVAHARSIVELVRGCSLINATGYMIAYLPTYQKARQLVAEGVLGRVYRFGAGAYMSQVFKEGASGWRFDPAQSGGGTLAMMASHALYMLYGLFGPARAAFASQSNVYSSVDDCIHALLWFGDEGQISGSLDSSWSVPGFQRLGLTLTLEGTNGMLALDQERLTLNLYKSAAGFEAGWHVIAESDLPDEAAFDLGGAGYYPQDRDFVNACAWNGSVAVTFEDGLAVQQIIGAIKESAERGEKVTL
jgi:nucleoside-diphosphate-sugar epimerase/predicted dehydrogenase